MTLTEAIEINKDRRRVLLLHQDKVGADAQMMGIEALKAIDGIRKHHHLYTATLLPGETED